MIVDLCNLKPRYVFIQFQLPDDYKSNSNFQFANNYKSNVQPIPNFILQHSHNLQLSSDYKSNIHPFFFTSNYQQVVNCCQFSIKFQLTLTQFSTAPPMHVVNAQLQFATD